ncbi:MAG TPA: FkbM family methyltransferase [Pyrinomonadaceae bacterium]|nr:FkbM family methyltransferase [Pyrinomonadaceae bacterium]
MRYVSDLFTNPVGRKSIAEDREVYKKLLKPDSLCFDVGANIGAKSLSMLGAGCRVVAFEPQPNCALEIESRCKPYASRLTLCKKALGREPGNLVLHSDEIHHNYASFHNDWEGDLKVEIPVEVITLDEAIRIYGKPDYLKIDVEGWEFEVLSGLSHSIPIVSFEYHLADRELQATRNCIDHLSKLSGNGLELNVAEAETSRFLYDNWLPEAEFWKVFPENFYDRPGYTYGDIWVRAL